MTVYGKTNLTPQTLILQYRAKRASNHYLVDFDHKRRIDYLLAKHEGLTLPHVKACHKNYQKFQSHNNCKLVHAANDCVRRLILLRNCVLPP